MITFHAARKQFQDAQREYMDFGAWDTEPTAEFSILIEKVLTGEDYKVPTTIRGWQLYSTMKGSGKAAQALTSAARKAVTAAKRDPIAAAHSINLDPMWIRIPIKNRKKEAWEL